MFCLIKKKLLTRPRMTNIILLVTLKLLMKQKRAYIVQEERVKLVWIIQLRLTMTMM